MLAAHKSPQSKVSSSPDVNQFQVLSNPFQIFFFLTKFVKDLVAEIHLNPLKIAPMGVFEVSLQLIPSVKLSENQSITHFLTSLTIYVQFLSTLITNGMVMIQFSLSN